MKCLHPTLRFEKQKIIAYSTDDFVEIESRTYCEVCNKFVGIEREEFRK